MPAAAAAPSGSTSVDDHPFRGARQLEPFGQRGVSGSTLMPSVPDSPGAASSRLARSAAISASFTGTC